MNLIRSLLQAIRSLFTGGAPLCDKCKYDYGNVCTRSDRPNAKRCPDYRRK